MSVNYLNENSKKEQMKKYFLLAIILNCVFELVGNFKGLLPSTGWLYDAAFRITFAVNPFGWLLKVIDGVTNINEILFMHALVVILSISWICMAGFLRGRSMKIFRIVGTVMLSIYVLLGCFSFIN